MQTPSFRRDFSDTRPSLLVTLRELAATAHGAAPAGPEQGAWRRFFELYTPPVYRVARRRGLGAADAEDVVQQVMMAVLGHIGEFEYERSRGRFRQWVLRITENKIRDLMRRRRSEKGVVRAIAAAADDEEHLDPLTDLAGTWEEHWHLQDVMYCLDQVAADISPRRMEAFTLYAIQGVPAAETARQVGMTVAAVYVTRNEVLAMIRTRLKRLQPNAVSGGECGGETRIRGAANAEDRQ